MKANYLLVGLLLLAGTANAQPDILKTDKPLIRLPFQMDCRVVDQVHIRKKTKAEIRAHIDYEIEYLQLEMKELEARLRAAIRGDEREDLTRIPSAPEVSYEEPAWDARAFTVKADTLDGKAICPSEIHRNEILATAAGSNLPRDLNLKRELPKFCYYTFKQFIRKAEEEPSVDHVVNGLIHCEIMKD